MLSAVCGRVQSAIGDYLGQHDDFQLSVMHKYCESIPFGGLKFDQAIRVFLQGFRLPGEAQKIDRIMEKFAERYATRNPPRYPSFCPSCSPSVNPLLLSVWTPLAAKFSTYQGRRTRGTIL